MAYLHNERVNQINSVMGTLKDSYYKKVLDLNATAYITKEPVNFAERMTGEKREIAVGEKWGELWDCAWFHFTAEVPADVRKEDLVLLLDVSGEGLVVNESGDPLIGITNGSVAYEYCTAYKRVVPFDILNVEDGKVDVWVDAGCNDLFGRFVDSGKLVKACVAIRNQELRSLYYDAETLKFAMEATSEDNPRRFAIMYTMCKAFDELYFPLVGEGVDDAEALEQIKAARAILKKELDKKGGDPSLKLHAIGHAHIDLAWLWPIRETVRKGARTFSTVMRLMEKYPDYKFGASQPQLFDWMKEHYPALYAEMGERIKEKRFEVQGAMWVEADTNVSGGEALVRQVLYGKKFYQDEFGIEVTNLWLPDVFGYSGALPQILKKSDVPYFMTQKLSWNRQNPFPYHVFNWKGIDGSSVLCHMLPEENYNSAATPGVIRKCEKTFREKGQVEDALVLFGTGNGGGGPAAHHLERLDRIGNMADFSPIKQTFGSDFFDILAKDIDSYHTWNGELYFECHRGTYTSQADNKKYNRKIEFALRELEYAASLAFVNENVAYPKAELERIWKEVLLYQFHDILPGSSIKRVYDESVVRYKQLLDEVESLTTTMYKAIAKGKGKTVINSLSYDREEYINVDGTYYFVKVPALSSVELTDGITVTTKAVDSKVMENDNLKVSFDETGKITSIFDKVNGKETLAQPAHVYDVYDDDGDAWDFQEYYDRKKPRAFALVSQEMETNEIATTMKQVYSFGKSKLTALVSLTKGDNKVVFDVTVDWNETRKMLRTAFPVNVVATEATCNIQFGNLKRPTIRNTSWDLAKFEVCAHKFVDMSQNNFGVALLSESKYGFQVIDNVMDMNLLRSPMYPGENMDKGIHNFQYAILPHAGNEVDANIVKEGYLFNVKPVIVEGSIDASIVTKLVASNKDNIVVEAVKKAEDSDDIVVRLYEANGLHTTANIAINPKFTSVTECNLIEREMDCLALVDGQITMEFTPYEIKTIKLK